MQTAIVMAMFSLAWQPSPTSSPTSLHCSALRRRSLPLLTEGTPDPAEVANKARIEQIRAGGFVDGRPPDDIDKLMTFNAAEMPLVGKLTFGLSGVLFLALAGFLILS